MQGAQPRIKGELAFLVRWEHPMGGTRVGGGTNSHRRDRLRLKSRRARWAPFTFLASAGEPTLRSLTLVAGPIDARRNPTGINQLAAHRPLAWFRQDLFHVVPDPYTGTGRKVYPFSRRYAGLLAANRLFSAHWDYYADLVRAEAHREACDALNAVLDMAAEFYLDAVRIVFQEFGLPLGDWCVRGQPVRPKDIHTTALLKIEGELDDISGRGQTEAALGLCQGISPCRKRHVTVRQCGHYDLFSGPSWRTGIYPIVRDQIRRYAGS